MRHPRARYASLQGFVPACLECDVDPVPILRAHGLDPGLLDHPDAWAPAHAVASAIDAAARAGDDPTLALRMARYRSLSTLGPISLVLSEEPTTREALDLLARFYPTYNEALRLDIDQDQDTTTVVVRFAFDTAAPQERAVELVLAVLVAIVRTLLPGTSPQWVRLRHVAPADDAVLAQVFGVRPWSCAGDDAVAFSTPALLAPRDASDPQRHRYALQLLPLVGPASRSTRSEQALRLVADLLPTGRCSAGVVANALHVDRRTLHRWLEAEGTTFRAAVEAERRRRVEWLLLQTTTPLTQVGELLGFATATSFSRWFTQVYGVSASRWRGAHGA